MKPKLFGSSGIRGLANIDITTTLAQHVGAAIATMNQGGQVVVGYDARLSGPMLEMALSSGLNAAGADVIKVGLVPTPVTAWMIGETGSDAGVEVTASHNPPQYNGLKVFNREGMSLTIKEQLATEKVLVEESYDWAQWDTIGATDEVDAIEAYVEMLADSINIENEIMIAADCFCGATSTLAPLAFGEFPLKSNIINAVPDGTFPAGNPEPSRESLMGLGRYMKALGCEVGFGFDGDGDRMMPVDENGSTPSPDTVLAAYAGYLVRANGGGTVVTHVGASMSVEEAVEAAGGSVVRTKVGDVHVTEAMLENGAIFGGEPVGAWIHPDVHLCPDGILSAVRLMQALDSEGKTLSQFVSGIPDYPTLRAKVACPNSEKDAAMGSISDIGEEFGDVTDVSTVDGVRLQLEDGWVLIRPSGTEPIIRITVEAHDEGRAKGLLETSRNFVQSVLGG